MSEAVASERERTVELLKELAAERKKDNLFFRGVLRKIHRMMWECVVMSFVLGICAGLGIAWLTF